MKPNVLYIHGWSSSPRVWCKLCPDNDAIYPSFQDISDLNDFLPEVTKVLPDSVTHVVAWSLGAMLAIELAAQCPDRIASLVLLGGTPRFANNNQSLGWPERVVRRMQKQLTVAQESTLQTFTRQMFCDLEEDALNEYGSNIPLAGDYSTEALHAGLEYLATRDLTEQLSGVTCPVLWIHGESDAICPTAVLNSVPANHKRHILSNTGHVPHWSRPDKVRQLIEEFSGEVTS